jgi:hypothetical protein
MMMRPPGLIPKTGNSIADLILGLLQPENPADAALDLAGPIGMAGNFAKKAGTGIASRLLGKAKKVYHGTPHTFKPEPGYPLGRFERGHIGTGEGGGAFGVGEGGYHGELQGTGRSYRGMTDEPDMRIGGQRVEELYSEIENAAARIPVGPRLDAEYEKMSLLENLMIEGDLTGVRDRFDPEYVSRETMEWFEKKVAPNFTRKGNVYESALHAVDDEFLHWDKRLSEQSEKVQSAFKEQFPEGIGGAELYGRDIYKEMGTKKIGGAFYTNKKSASDFLEAKGLKGIKFLDQGSRTAGEGTSNYIVFNPDDLEILRILGLTGAVLGTGAVVGSGTVLDDEMPDDI